MHWRAKDSASGRYLAGAHLRRRHPPVMLDANSDDNCIGLIAWMHTFSPAKMWISGLTALQKPLLHLHTQAGESLPWSEIDMDFMNLNQAAHGDREFGFIQARLGVPPKDRGGPVSDPETLAAIGALGRAADGAATIRALRVARFGDNMRDVAVTEGDKVEARRRFGVSVNTYGVNDLVLRIDQVTDAEIDLLVADYDQQYEVVPALRRAVTAHALRYAAQIELGLRQFLQAGNFGAFTTNFEDLGGLRQLPGIAVQRLMADGYGFGGEGDWKTSVLLATIKAMGRNQDGGTSFMEDYTYHLARARRRFSARTCSRSAPPSPRTSRGSKSTRWESAVGRTPYGWSSTPNPGPATVVGSGDLGERFRMVANEITVVHPDEPLPKLPVARAVWVPKPAGSGHFGRVLDQRRRTAPHRVVDRGRHRPARRLRQPARRGAVDHRRLDHRRDFADRIRWNQAYYRLAQGF